MVSGRQGGNLETGTLIAQSVVAYEYLGRLYPDRAYSVTASNGAVALLGCVQVKRVVRKGAPGTLLGASVATKGDGSPVTGC